jgi:hypothetical protein
MIEAGRLVRITWVLVEHVQQSLICLRVEVMDLIASSQQVRDSLGRWLVDDGGGNDVGHVAVILLNRDLE